MENEKQYSYEEFTEIIRRLRAKDGCPWDREQTHSSLKNCMIEEAYEVVEGINEYEKTKDSENLCEELGDVLLQVVMHAIIAEEEGIFTMEDVISGISKKMIRRHPHVFGTEKIENTEDLLQNWEDIKKQEKQEETISDGMKRVARALPATIRAEKIQKKAARVGLEQPTYELAEKEVLDKIKDLEKARKNKDFTRIMDEYGELLFDVVKLSRFLQLNVENSLTNATDKFINRFVSVEKLAILQGKRLDEMSIGELEALWGRIK
ncbi:MAG: nucleoside triphosphate pyrophosphohydrolase [bacterium]|nr:nucleoside triphosphate pyrophosphohydrolase [bacterium]